MAQQEFNNSPTNPLSPLFTGVDVFVPQLQPFVKPVRAIVLGTGPNSSITLAGGVVTCTSETGKKLSFAYSHVRENSVDTTNVSTQATAEVLDIQAVGTTGIASLSTFRFEGRMEYPVTRDYTLNFPTAATATQIVTAFIAEINADVDRLVDASVGATSTKLRLTSIKKGVSTKMTLDKVAFSGTTVVTAGTPEFLTGPTLREIADLTAAESAAGKTYKLISLVVNFPITAANFGFTGGRDGVGNNAFCFNPKAVWLLFDQAVVETGTVDFDEAVAIFSGAKPQAAYLSRIKQ